ncbi:hypothetical protein GBF35_46085 [Nonomuraea phyllanthi]|uniref:hypothetical protein n=1 Tax=Nonomuraea phyllanthi TaxID=2219224 RepID=UPI0012938E25|nr:hypothetical protein [Nonomuraea phyllanthi]QFY12957.1 hypothetical protein GBF35_46085 [Nonomuraea phyllanthi]
MGQDVLDSMGKALGALYQLKVTKAKYLSLFDRWPACVALTLTGVAVHHYRQGTFWPYLRTTLGYRSFTIPQDSAAWGAAYLDALKRFRLPLFSEREQKYVGPILMHAGIPTFCLDDFFALLLRRHKQDPAIDADALLSWATARETRLHSLDVPARRFIRNGTDFAVDVIDRCLDLLDRMRSPEPDLGGLGLPVRFIERAQELIEQGRLDLRRSTATPARHTQVERPRLGLDPFGQGVQIVLPPVGEAPDGMARWNVTVDGVPNLVRSRPLWVGAAEGAPTTSFPLTRPARVAQVSLQGAEHETEIGIVDSGDPLLIFTESGRQLQPHLGVPPDAVWFLHPRDRKVIADAPPRVIAESPLPVGWDGWRLVQVVLEGATWVALNGDDAKRRPIRGHSKPRVITGDPVPGVTTPYGSPVYSKPPAVWLPAETPTTWLIDIRSATGDEKFLTRRFTVEEPTEISEQLWADLPRPLLGAFEVTVRGPIGRNARRTISIAEGLALRCAPSVRLFNGDGLVPGEASLICGPGMTVDRPALSYSSVERERVVTCTASDRTEPLIVAPRSMRVLVEEANSSPRWNAGPVRLHTEGFHNADALLVEVPGIDALPPLQVQAGRQVIQEIAPSGRGRYSLRRALDTVQEHRSVDLVLPLAGVPVLVGSVRPARLAAGVTAAGESLLLDGCVWVENLTAGLYLCTAPWREPEIVPVEKDGSIPLPDDLVNAGRMHVRLVVEDPWVASEWPRWPHPREMLVCEAPGQFEGGDAEDRQLSGYLAGANAFPENVSHLDRLWTIVDLANRIDHSTAARWIEDSAVLLRNHPEAIRSLPDAGLPPDRAVVALITTGLAAARVDHCVESDIALWRKAPVAAVLLTGSSLADAVEDSDLLAEVGAECGESALAILRGEDDPFAAAGLFDMGAELMARQDPEMLESLWSAAQVVPSALLDEDTRVTAARLLFDQRNCRDGRKLADQAERVVREGLALPINEYRAAGKYVALRCHPKRLHGWVSLPAMSIALALIARMAAHGHANCRVLEERFRFLWRMLAKIAPALTTIDLVRAELIVAARPAR